MNIKTITNQSSLTIIIIAIMLFISLGNAQAQTNQKPTSNETVLILELIKQMQTQMAENQKQTNQQMAELKAELKAQMAENQKQTNQQIAELKTDVQGLKADVQGLKADVQGLKADIEKIKTLFGVFQSVFAIIFGCGLLFILNLFKQEIKNFIINLFTSSKNITNMKIKTITNQSSLTIIIIAIMLFISLGNAQAQTNQKPTSNETVLILELIKQMQTQMAENQKQTNQQMAELKAELKAQMAENQKQTNQQIAELKTEMKEIKAEQKELRAEMQTIKQKVDRIGFYFDMLQYVFLTILGSAVIYILALFREQIKNFIINLFTSSKNITNMKIKTITNQSSLTIIIIAIMLLISLGNAQAQTNQKPTSNETVLILELIKQMQTQMAENQKQTNQQMAENQKQINQQMAELKAEMKEIKAEQKELTAEMQTIKQKVDRIGFYFDMLQYVFLTILGSAVIYILALFREQIKNFIINLFTSSKNITNMKIKTITNQSTLTMIIIAIMLFISLGNAQAQTNQKPTSNETVLILELIKQMQTQMAENQKQTNQQMAENQKQTNQQIAELKTDVQGLKADVQGLKADIEKIKTLFGVFQSVFAIIFGCGLLFILNLFKQEIKNFIINLFTSSKNITNMKIKTITNQSSLTIIIITIMLLISLGNAQAQTYRDTDNDGLIEISYIDQLDSIRYNLTGTCSGSTCNGYELTRSLDFNNPSSYRSGVVNDSLTMGSGWNPIGTYSYPSTDTEFNTTFEGNSYTIDHLYINRPSTHYIGLFVSAQSNSRIRNIGLTNLSVSGKEYVGGLVGYNNGTISQSHSTGYVTGSNYYVGGLVGINYYGTISQSHSTGSVTGSNGVGGLVGAGYNATISQSYATGSVTGSNGVGGLVGAGYNATISQSYATGSVTGSDGVGGLVGGNENGTISHVYWNTNAAQTVNGTLRNTHNTVGIDFREGSVIETHIRGLTLSALESPTGTAADTIQELGPGFIYRQGLFPAIHKGARVTINSVNFTQTVPSITNILTSSVVADVIEGTATTRATLTVGGIQFTANVIGTTNITNPYTITNIQNGTGRGIVGKYQSETGITFAPIGAKTFGDAPFVLSAISSATTPIVFLASSTIVSISSNTVTIHGAGIVNITASTENDSIVRFATQILIIDKKSQSITFETLANGTFGDVPFVLSASSSAGLSVLFSASSTLVSISNNTVTLNGIGTVSITAYLPSNSYTNSSVTQILTIQPSLVYRDRDGDGLIEISTIDQLDSIRYNLTGICASGTCNGYELTRSLDFNNPSSYRSGTVNTAFTTGSGWNPIGISYDASFNTTFEGNNYTIDHLYINRPSTNYIGLFGYTQSNTRIRNIGLTNVSVSGNNPVGGLVGYNNYGTISQSHSTGSVTGYERVGGLVGYNNYGTISQSHSTGAVTVTGYRYVGGLVGYNSSGGTISQSYATVAVTGSSYSSSVGGLVGENYSGTISQSYATGSVSGSIGVGGLVGYSRSATISQSYATGAVTGNYSFGGLVGTNDNATISHGYWNKDATQTGIGTNNGTVSYIRGLTLSALQSPTATASDSIQELGPGFIYKQGLFPAIDKGARVTINGVNFTQQIPTVTNIDTSSTVASVIQGTATTRATLTVGGIQFTANVIGTTNITNPYTITNIQNGTGRGIVGKYQSETGITFAPIGTKTFGDAPFVLSATSSAHLPVLFSASNTIVHVNNNTVTIRAGGTVHITAYSENDTLFGFATQILTIHKVVQSISFDSLAQKTFGDAPFVLTARSSAGLPVLFSASNTIVHVNNNTVTIRAGGTVHITAYSENDTLFGFATQILTIHKVVQSISFDSLAQKTFGDAPFVLSASSSAGLSVLFSASSPLVSISNNTVTLNGIGTVSITAYLPSNSYTNSSVTQILTIQKRNQTITFETLANRTFGDAPFVLSASSSASVPVSYFTSSNIVSIRNNTVTINGIGTVSITAYLPSNSYTNNSVTQILTIQPSLFYRDRDGDGLIEISTIDQLDSIRYNLTGICASGTCNGYELTRSLDFNNPSSYRSGTVNTAFTTGSGWNPIGISYYASFNTTLEGNGFTIDHLYINRTSTDFIGLFGSTGSNSRIRNIGLNNVSVRGNSSVGGLVGANAGTINQSYATGSVWGNYYVGGLVGYNGGTIIQSYATGSVTGSNQYVGGLVGYNYYGTISQSHSTGAVTGNTSVGGLVGYNDSGTISQSYATGAVSGNNSVSGLVGYNYGTIRHGYWNLDAAQTVSGTARSKNTKVGIGTNYGTFSYLRGFSLSALQSPTGTVSDSIQELGPGFVYRQGFLPVIHKGARVTINNVHFTQTVPSITNIVTSSPIANVMQGTATTRATLTVDGIHFTANVIDTTSGRLRTPYIITNIQNGTEGNEEEKIAQTITFFALAVRTFGNAPFVLSATSSAGLSVLFSASNTLINIDNNTVSINGVGTVNITAYNSGNSNYLGASATRTLTILQTLTIQKRNQSITFGALANRTFGDAPFVLRDTTENGLSIIYSSASTKVRITENTISILAAGYVSITASVSGGAVYGDTSVSLALVVRKYKQYIDFPRLPVVNFKADSTFSAHTTASGSYAITYKSSNTSVALIDNAGIITLKGVGFTEIVAYQPDTSNIVATPVRWTLLVKAREKQAHRVTFLLPNILYKYDTIPLDARSDNGLKVFYGILENENQSGNTIARLDTAGSLKRIIVLDTGILKIRAFSLGNALINPAEVVSIRKVKNVYRISGLVTDSLNNPIRGIVVLTQKKGIGQIQVTSLSPTGTFSFSYVREGGVFFLRAVPLIADTGKYFVTYYGVRRTLVWAGADTLVMNEDKTGLTWQIRTKQVKRVRGRANITGIVVRDSTGGSSRIVMGRVTGTPLAHITVILKERTTGEIIATTTSDTNGEFAFINLPLGNYEVLVDVSGAVLSNASSGNLTIANEDATLDISAFVNENGLSLEKSIIKAKQTITFVSIPQKTIGDAPFTLVATTSSKLGVQFTASNSHITIQGNTITIHGVGSVNITASQTGNEYYEPAKNVIQTLVVVSAQSPLTPIEKANVAIRIYPNPAQDYITIQTDKTQKVASVKVYDIMGKSYELGIRNYELGLRVDFKTLSKGEYIIILYGEKGEVLKSEKIIKN